MFAGLANSGILSDVTSLGKQRITVDLEPTLSAMAVPRFLELTISAGAETTASPTTNNFVDC